VLRWLTTNGFEVGNHTADHVALSSLDSDGVQREIAEGAEIIESAVPGYRIRTLALPFGAVPSDPELVVRGAYGARPYGPYAVLLVGSNPAPSPFSTEFEPSAIPRIRTSHLPWQAVRENYDFAYWLRQLEVNRAAVFVSDGDASRITFPSSAAGQLAPRYRAKANPS
jgi:peptidoglycan/xylan/chitin deacetylase (PgdA/CDA1 family)